MTLYMSSVGHYKSLKASFLYLHSFLRPQGPVVMEQKLLVFLPLQTHKGEVGLHTWPPVRASDEKPRAQKLGRVPETSRARADDCNRPLNYKPQCQPWLRRSLVSRDGKRPTSLRCNLCEELTTHLACNCLPRVMNSVTFR